VCCWQQHGRGGGGELRLLRAGGGVHRRLHRRRAGQLRRPVAVRAVLGGRQVRGRQVRGHRRGGGRGGGRARAHGDLPHAQERRARRARRRRHAADAAHRVREADLVLLDAVAERAPPRVGVVRRDLIAAGSQGSRACSRVRWTLNSSFSRSPPWYYWRCRSWLLEIDRSIDHHGSSDPVDRVAQ
jgi:hypothetical protein